MSEHSVDLFVETDLIEMEILYSPPDSNPTEELYNSNIYVGHATVIGTGNSGIASKTPAADPLADQRADEIP